MDDSPASIPAPYQRLQAKSAGAFPLDCPTCRHRFTGLRDYVAHTAPVNASSGLAERSTPDGSSVILVRNCRCGSALTLECRDRRDRTTAGVSRRNRFAGLVTVLTGAGFPRRQAEAEVRRLLALGAP